jgi:poly(A) polymerase
MDAKREAATDIVRRLRAERFQAYLVGGCVRDLVMGREPKDYDVSTDATPDQVVKLFPDSLTVGAQFGVVIVPRAEGNVEVATFRSDGRYTDGRHPSEVRYAKTPQEDVRRRDFTINGLLLDPLEDQVLDYVGGQGDIRARRIRAIGDPIERFHEDRLRMLRAVRFAARFGFSLDAAALEAIRKLAPLIRDVSAERVRDEILKILTEGQARRGFELLDETGLLQEVLPEVKATQGVPQPPEFHPEGDVWVHTLLMLEGLRAPTPTLALGVLLHDVGKLFEYKKERGAFVKSREGELLRHPISGAAFAFQYGFPQEIIHIIAAHSKEGDGTRRTIEAIIVNHADFVNFDVLKA